MPSLKVVVAAAVAAAATLVNAVPTGSSGATSQLERREDSFLICQRKFNKGDSSYEWLVRITDWSNNWNLDLQMKRHGCPPKVGQNNYFLGNTRVFTFTTADSCSTDHMTNLIHDATGEHVDCKPVLQLDAHQS